MSGIDKVDDIFFLIKKYLLPTVFLGAGIYLLYLAVTPAIVEVQDPETLEIYTVENKQDPLFMYASLIMIMVSVIWFLYLLEMIKSAVGYGIMGVMLIGSVVVLWMDYATVKEQVDFKNAWEERDIEIKARMLDVKAAEIAYKEVNGTYTDSFDDLINFVKTGEKMDFYKEGSLPERKMTPEERDLIYGDNRPIDKLMNEYEATFLARMNGNKIDGQDFRRDTNYVSVMEAIFNSERYLESRSKLDDDLIPFHPDSMRFVPYTTDLATLDTASILKNEIVVPTLFISMTHPLEDEVDGRFEYTVGSITENHLRENWD